MLIHAHWRFSGRCRCFEDEGDYEDYSIFSRSIPTWPPQSEVELNIIQDRRKIHVGCIDIIATASASVVQVGPNDTMDLESRVKAIRHFITGAPEYLKDYKESLSKEFREEGIISIGSR